MKRLLPLLFLLVTLIPVAVMGWLGVRLAGQEQARLEGEFRELLTQRLAETGRLMARVVEERRQQISANLGRLGRNGPEALAALQRDESLYPPRFLLAADGRLLFPDGAHPRSERERGFLERLRPLWEERTLLHLPAEGAREGGRGDAGAREGWYAWHWGDGLHLIYWQRLADGAILGGETEPLGLLAQLIAALPAGESLPQARIRLGDGRGRVLYQWGGFEPAAEAAPLAELPLAPPLEGWRLAYFGAIQAQGAAVKAQQMAGLAALGLFLCALAIFLYRELTRHLREAAQRVNFVNQVSHELRTPLTNIRLYAELLQEELEEGPARQRVEVIVGEAQRLSRLIANVLSFARGQRGAGRLNPVRASLDDCVRDLLAQFAPVFAGRGIEVIADLQAPGPIPLDPDAVAQILGNLFTNVEKYAAKGKRIVIATRLLPDHAELAVADAGPGIPPRHRRRIFEPFYRVRSDLTEGVSGAGLGLSIARDLARLHGGELALAESDVGAQFVLALPIAAPGKAEIREG